MGRDAEADTSTAPGELCDLTLRIAGMSCAACQAHVQHALAEVNGVHEANVDLLAHTAHLRHDGKADLSSLTAAVRRAGYDIAPSATGNQAGSSSPAAAGAQAIPAGSESGLGLRVVLSLVAGAAAMLLSMPLMSSTMRPAEPASMDRLTQALMRWSSPLLPGPLLHANPDLLRWVLLLLALGTMLFAAPEIYSAAWRAARHRTTNMNTLVALGTLVAFAASAYTTVLFSLHRPSRNFTDVSFEAVVLILAFLLAGRWLEARARERANRSLRAFAHQGHTPARWLGESDPATLAKLHQDPAALLNAPETLLPLDAVALGDLVRILPGDQVPLDGIVLLGRSAVDESTLTGESLPASRGPGDKLFAGTLNLEGPLLLRATALGADSMQAQMARMLERARATRAPLQRLADRVSAVFVPSVLALAALTFALWAIVDNTGSRHLGYGRALSLAVAVLVVACPCAMGLAVPAAVAVSLGTAARMGVLIKGGEVLERLALLDVAVFDKTGTLTEGRPEIVAVQPATDPPADENTLLQWASALESASTHPLARAVRGYAAARRLTEVDLLAESIEVLPGLGIRGTTSGGHALLLGRSPEGVSPPATTPPGPVPPHAGERAAPAYATPLHLSVDGRLALSLFAVDTLRPTAAPALVQLTSLGVRTELLTGDVLAAAQPLADALGIPVVRAQQFPGDKLAAITEAQGQGHRVAMVGDGLNDAAALARADAGFAMVAGTDLAREAGHVLLLHPDLTLIPATLQLARRARRLMRQNLLWAMLYNLLGLPLAAGLLLPRYGLVLSPALASAAMALSSTSVLLNSLRLARATPVRPVSRPLSDKPRS